MKVKIISAFFISLLFITSLRYASCKIIVISDLEDTVRQTNIANPLVAIANLVTGFKPYSGLGEIYTDLSDWGQLSDESIQFFYIDNSLNLIFDAAKWPKKNRFPQGVTIQRKFGQKKSGFKKFTIKSILERQMKDPGDLVIFFGDNAQSDPAIYKAVAVEQNIQNYKIFIRDVRTEATPHSNVLPVKTLEKINYFFSELELLNNPDLPFITEKTKKNIIDLAVKDKLIPSYTKQALADRIYHIKGGDEQSANIMANKIIDNYYYKLINNSVFN